MQFLLGFLTLISLAVAIFGDLKIEEDHGLARGYIKCGNRYCHDGFYCFNGYCRVKQACAHHSHCPKDQYCDTNLHACRKGVRRCYNQAQCGYKNMCKDGICQKRECIKHTDCPGNQACHYPPGYCKEYESYCYEGYHGYCKAGYVCVDRKCKKRECNYVSDCKLGDHCVNGFCKPRPGFCMNNGECNNDQCCAKAGNNEHGLCKPMSKPGRGWCPLQQSLQACPCVSGYLCEQTTSSTYWGRCVATDGGSGSGSGSGDF